MKPIFDRTIVLKLEKDSPICNLSIKSSENEVRVIKVSRVEIDKLVAEYLAFTESEQNSSK